MTIPALLFSQHSQSIIIWLTKDAPKIQPAAFKDDVLHLSDQAEGLKSPPFIALLDRKTDGRTAQRLQRRDRDGKCTIGGTGLEKES